MTSPSEDQPAAPAEPSTSRPPAELPIESLGVLVEAVPGPCLLVTDGVIEAANPEVVELTGVPAHRLVGVRLGDLLLPELEAPWLHAMANAQSNVSRLHTRLASSLMPLELSVRRLGRSRLLVGLRTTAPEHHYSALAGAELTHDLVTGLANRYHILSLLHHRIVAADRNPLAIVGLWIDELPALASNQGDRAVDRIIREVGQRLQSRLRSPDVLGRFDHAGLLCLLGSDAPVSQLTEIADRLRSEVAFPVAVGDGLVSFTASVAVASITGRRPSIERTLAQLEAMAARAAQGGNRTEILEL